MNAKELSQAANMLIEENGINPDVIKDALREAYTSAYKRAFEQADNIEVEVDLDNSDIQLAQVKEVIPDDGPIDEVMEIRLKDAKEINSAYEIGDTIKFELSNEEFGRYAAQSAKNRFLQLIRDAEKQIVLEEYVDQQHEIVSARVSRGDARFIYVTLPGGQEVSMSDRDLIPGETFELGQIVKVLITNVDVDNKSGNPVIRVSRTDPEFVKRLFEQEVPEVYDGSVIIEKISREAGDRSKVAVHTENPDIDPIGALVGPGGNRVQAVIRELHGEKMDIIEWVEDEAQFIANALNPSEVLDVVFDPENENKVTVIVPDHQLSLAIGKRGQNARLTAKLTDFKIDIKTATQANEDPELQATIAKAAEFAAQEEFIGEDEDVEVFEYIDDENEDNLEVEEVIAEDVVDEEAVAEFTAALQDDTLIEQIKVDEEESDED